MTVEKEDQNGEPALYEQTLVIRVWQESEHGRPFRARLIARDEAGEPQVFLASDPDTVLDRTREWLTGHGCAEQGDVPS